MTERPDRPCDPDCNRRKVGSVLGTTVGDSAECDCSRSCDLTAENEAGKALAVVVARAVSELDGDPHRAALQTELADKLAAFRKTISPD